MVSPMIHYFSIEKIEHLATSDIASSQEIYDTMAPKLLCDHEYFQVAMVSNDFYGRAFNRGDGDLTCFYSSSTEFC